MTLIRRDNNELRYNSLLLLEKQGNPDYYTRLFRNARIFFYGMRRPELVEQMNDMIRKELEIKLGADIRNILLTYKNLPALNSFTRSRVAGKEHEYVYKHDLQKWLDSIEEWIFQRALELEPMIRFSIPPKQWI